MQSANIPDKCFAKFTSQLCIHQIAEKFPIAERGKNLAWPVQDHQSVP